ncbi:MAG: hypothetical protein LBQ67_01295 [Treponema sp.]|nr:hypothetical protein [Treponema sp.]
MDLGKIREKVKSPGEFLKSFLDEKAGPLADKFLSRLPEEKRRPLLFCFGGILVLLICLIVITLVMSLGGPREGEGQEAVELTIPVEELFFPGEPDFVPSILLEREPRRFWTADDAGPFWKDPGELGRDQWLKEMELVIDKLMEGVP